MGGTCPVSRLDRVLTAVSRITHEGRLLYLHDVRQLPGLIEKRLLWTLQPEENLKFTHYHEERNHQGKDNVLLDHSIGFQEQVSNHLQAAVVKSHGGERWRKSANITRAGEHPRDERK